MDGFCSGVIFGGFLAIAALYYAAWKSDGGWF